MTTKKKPTGNGYTPPLTYQYPSNMPCLTTTRTYSSYSSFLQGDPPVSVSTVPSKQSDGEKS